MALNLKTLGTRSLSAVFFVIILVSCIWFSYLSFLLLFFAVALIALTEYYRLVKNLNVEPHRFTGYFAAILLFIYFSIENLSGFLPLPFEQIKKVTLALLIVCPSFLLIKALFSTSPNSLLNAQYTLLGILYAVFPLSLLISLPAVLTPDGLSYNYFKVLGILFLIWGNDTLAYLGGSLVGKNKMYERISPAKPGKARSLAQWVLLPLGFY